MKREKRLTKKERKAQVPTQMQAGAAGDHHGHIHCIACGKHLDADMFGEVDGAEFIRCDHGADFPSCIACHDASKALIEAHDRTKKPVQKAAAWH